MTPLESWLALLLVVVGVSGALVALFHFFSPKTFFHCPTCGIFWSTAGDLEITVDDQHHEAALEIRCEFCREQEDGKP